MHEFSICQSLIESILSELDKVEHDEIKRLLKVRIAVGELRQIVPAYLKEAYSILAKDTAADGAEMEIRSLPVRGKCKTCGWEGNMPDFNFCCKKCGSENAEIVGGRELYIENLEVETES